MNLCDIGGRNQGAAVAPRGSLVSDDVGDLCIRKLLRKGWHLGTVALAADCLVLEAMQHSADLLGRIGGIDHRIA